MSHDDEGLAASLAEIFGPGDWIDHLVAAHPVVAGGLLRLSTVASDGASLDAGTKLLFMAVVAAVKGEAPMAEALLDGAFAQGCAIEEAEGAAAAVLVSRGAPAFSAVAAVIAASGRSATRSEPTDTAATDEASILAYVEAAYGSVPERIRLMVDELPGALEGFHLLRSAGLRDAGLRPRDTELLLVALNSALLEPDFVISHARDARDEGATETQLAEAVATTIPLAGMAAWHAGVTGIRKSLELGSRRGPT